VDDVKAVAERTGDISKLSDTDVKVLALAKQLDRAIVSDDYSVQNVAGHAGIKAVSVHNPKIKRLKTWKGSGDEGDERE
jgi:UPF0271 protein